MKSDVVTPLGLCRLTTRPGPDHPQWMRLHLPDGDGGEVSFTITANHLGPGRAVWPVLTCPGCGVDRPTIAFLKGVIAKDKQAVWVSGGECAKCDPPPPMHPGTVINEIELWGDEGVSCGFYDSTTDRYVTPGTLGVRWTGNREIYLQPYTGRGTKAREAARQAEAAAPPATG
jgi:hypothetical protein